MLPSPISHLSLVPIEPDILIQQQEKPEGQTNPYGLDKATSFLPITELVTNEKKENLKAQVIFHATKDEAREVFRSELTVQKIKNISHNKNNFLLSLVENVNNDFEIKKIKKQKVLDLKTNVAVWCKNISKNLRSQIDLETWENYHTQLPNAGMFSSFLSKLNSGISSLFTFFPSFSCSKGVYCKKKIEFAETRLFPVLLAIQKNPHIAERVFCMAEDALGACSDRPTLTFVDIEMEVQNEIQLTVLKNLAFRPPISPSSKKACEKLILIEHQKLLKSIVISKLHQAFAQAFEIKETREIDPLQNVIVNYDKIAKASQLFPRPPYVNCASFVRETEQKEIREKIISNLPYMAQLTHPETLVNHLLESDSWRTFLIMKHPELDKELQDITALRTQKTEEALSLEEISNENIDWNKINSEYMVATSALFQSKQIRQFTSDWVASYVRSDSKLSFTNPAFN